MRCYYVSHLSLLETLTVMASQWWYCIGSVVRTLLLVSKNPDCLSWLKGEDPEENQWQTPHNQQSSQANNCPSKDLYKYSLIPAAQNKSRTFEKDYETRPADVNPDDDPTFKKSGQHLKRQLINGLRTAKGQYKVIDKQDSLHVMCYVPEPSKDCNNVQKASCEIFV